MLLLILPPSFFGKINGIIVSGKTVLYLFFSIPLLLFIFQRSPFKTIYLFVCWLLNLLLSTFFWSFFAELLNFYSLAFPSSTSFSGLFFCSSNIWFFFLAKEKRKKKQRFLWMWEKNKSINWHSLTGTTFLLLFFPCSYAALVPVFSFYCYLPVIKVFSLKCLGLLFLLEACQFF